jgi:hypothetical protein
MGTARLGAETLNQLARTDVGRLSGWSGQYFRRLGGVDGSGEVENSLRQLAGGFHGYVVAHAVE